MTASLISPSTRILIYSLLLGVLVLPVTSIPVTAISNSPKNYTIRYLDSSTAYFSNQIRTTGGSPYDWQIGPLLSSSISSRCGTNSYLLGGINVFQYNTGSSQAIISKIIGPNLPSHNSILMKFSLWFIDQWSISYRLIITLQSGTSNTPISGIDQNVIAQFDSQTSWLPNMCGSSDRDLGPAYYIASFTSTETSHLYFAITTQGMNNNYRGLFGIRDVELVFSSKVVATSSICAITTPTNLFGTGVTISNCHCDIHQYHNSVTCVPCDYSCGFCTGSNSDQCLNCRDGYSYDGAYCIHCHSSCKTCFGTLSNQCDSCPDSMFLYWDFTCHSSCNSPLIQSTYLGNSYCVNACDPNMYMYEDGSCHSQCPYKVSTEGDYTYCRSPCSQSAPFYNLDQKMCKSTCQTPHVVSTTGIGNICSLRLSEDERRQIKAVASASKAANTAVVVTQLIAGMVFSFDSSSMTSYSLSKLVSYMRYLDVPHSPQLEYMFENYQIPQGVLVIPQLQMTDDMKSRFEYGPPAAMFEKYQLVSSFLVSYWGGLTSLGLLFANFLLFQAMDCATSCLQKKYCAFSIFRRLRVLAQNYLFGQIYSSVDDITMLMMLELRAVGPGSYHVISISTSLIIQMILLIVVSYHCYLITTYQRLTKLAPNEVSEKRIEEFNRKHEGVSILYSDAKSSSFLHQSFLLLYTVRSMVCSLILTLLFKHPLVQIILMTILTVAMMIYLFTKRPFKSLLDLVQQVSFELLLLLANLCILVLAILDQSHKDSVTSISRVSRVLINVCLVSNILPNVFLIPKTIQQVREGYKEWMKFIRKYIAKIRTTMKGKNDRALEKGGIEVLRVSTFRNSINKDGKSDVSACIDLSTTSHNLQRQHESILTEKNVLKIEDSNKKIRRNKEAESARIRKVREIRALQGMQETQMDASLGPASSQIDKSDTRVLDHRYEMEVSENGSPFLRNSNSNEIEKEKDVLKDRFQPDKTFDNEQSDMSLDYIVPQRVRNKRIGRIGGDYNL